MIILFIGLFTFSMMAAISFFRGAHRDDVSEEEARGKQRAARRISKDGMCHLWKDE